jgi:hypothetical protein
MQYMTPTVPGHRRRLLPLTAALRSVAALARWTPSQGLLSAADAPRWRSVVTNGLTQVSRANQRCRHIQGQRDRYIDNASTLSSVPGVSR